MPKDFVKCVNENPNHVRTIRVGEGKYMHVCWDKSGKSHHGETKTKHKVMNHHKTHGLKKKIIKRKNHKRRMK